MAKASTPPIPTRFSRAVTLRGIQPKDQEAHVQARAVFLNCLRDDPGLIALFEGVGGFVDAAWALAAEGDRLAALAGLSSRAELLTCDDDVFERAIVGHETAFTAWRSHVHAFCAQDFDAIRPTLRRLRSTWALPRPWPWLIDDLHRGFVLLLYGILIGRKVRADYYVNAPGPTAIAPEAVTLTRRPGESRQQASRRIRAATRAALQQLGPPTIRSRTGTQQNPNRIKRDVEIFYRVCVRKGRTDTKYRIARDAGITEKTVRNALTRVEIWLDAERPGRK